MKILQYCVEFSEIYLPLIYAYSRLYSDNNYILNSKQLL